MFKRGPNIEDRWLNVGEQVVKAPIQKAIVHGRESMLFTPDSVAYINELCSQYAIDPIPIIGIPNARHHLMLDEPVAFASVLKTLLSIWQTKA